MQGLREQRAVGCLAVIRPLRQERWRLAEVPLLFNRCLLNSLPPFLLLPLELWNLSGTNSHLFSLRPLSSPPTFEFNRVVAPIKLRYRNPKEAKFRKLNEFDGHKSSDFDQFSSNLDRNSRDFDYSSGYDHNSVGDNHDWSYFHHDSTELDRN